MRTDHFKRFKREFFTSHFYIIKNLFSSLAVVVVVVVSVLALYFDDPSLNPDEVCSFLLFARKERKTKRGRIKNYYLAIIWLYRLCYNGRLHCKKLFCNHTSVTRLGNLLDFGQLFKAFGSS